MGLLIKPSFWTGVSREIWNARPLPAQAMSSENVARILHVGCRALTDLANDQDLEQDLAAAYEIARDPESAIKHAGGEFEAFIDEFMRAERDALLQSGCDFDLADDLLAGLDVVAQNLKDPLRMFDRFRERIRYCAGLSCAGEQDARTGKPNRSLAADVRKFIKGITIISANIAAEAHGTTGGLPPGTLGSVSINVGTNLVHDALRDRW